MEYLVSRTRFVFAFLLTLSIVGWASAGPGGLFTRKPKVDPAKAAVLIEILKSAPDEKKRKAAADELGGADPRACPEVAPALIQALRKDPSATVRGEAADALRHLDEVFSQAGVALEAAVESDPAPLVRLSAKRALWEYHLRGYRSTAKNADGLDAQTIEPPIASPAGPRPVVALVPAPPAPVVAARVPPVAAPPAPQLPQITAQPIPAPGPRLFWPNVLPGPRTALRAALDLGPPLILNLTDEPPLAKKPTAPRVTVDPQPTYTPEPPLRLPTVSVPLPAPPDYVPTLPPFQPDLPSVVTPPDAAPVPVPKITTPK